MPATATPAPTLSPPRRAPVRVDLAEVLAALSHAFDLTDGQRPGHTMRTCLVGMRLADELALSADARAALYFALLLKDAGCSSNAARLAALFAADDRVVKPGMKVADWHSATRLAIATFRHVAPDRPLGERVRQFLALARAGDTSREVIRIRCDRGAAISRRLGFPAATADAIRSLDEHWSGRGYPDGLRGEAIPLLSRVALLAQTVEAFFTEHGLDAALAVIRARRGRWFDPRLVDVVLRWRGDAAWWRALRGPDLVARVADVEPPAADALSPEGDARWLEDVAHAFADVVDAKSPYTFRHSTNVAGLAHGAARMAGLGADEERRLHRAGLLHDLGKLGVSNRILDKPGRLDAAERAAVECHPLHTWEILRRVRAFDDIAHTAALHHEKLDGSGYPWGLHAEQLDLPARLLVVSDIYEALTADRPYRAGLSPAAAMAILRRDRDTRLCGVALDALAAHVEETDGLVD